MVVEACLEVGLLLDVPSLQVSPPHSFIHSADFSSPLALAEYLKYLDSHPQEYLEYLAWKGHYQVPRFRV